MREITEARTHADQIVEEIAAECLESRILLGTVNARAVISKHIAAALAADAKGAGPVAVKPLEWNGPDCDGEHWASREKYVVLASNEDGYWLSGVGGFFPTVEAAKAAAQADFEQRIRSAIIDAPAALGAGPTPDGWQPIETAPRDGNEIILGGPGWSHAGFWDNGAECHRAGAGWFFEDDRASLLTARNCYPTHWCPLPTAPGEAT